MRLFLSLFFFTVVSSKISAVELRHSIAADDSPVSLQTLGHCYSLALFAKQRFCSPTSVFNADTGSIKIQLISQINEEGYAVADRLQSGDVDTEFFQRLFAEQNFQSFSGVAHVGAYVGNFSLIYTPAHAIGATKLENPSLPVIHASIVSQSLVTLQYNFNWSLGDSYEFLASPAVMAKKRRFASLDTDILTLSVSDPKDLVSKSDESFADGSLALGLFAKAPGLPSLHFRIDNAASDFACEECDSPFINVRSAVSRTLDGVISVAVNHPLGTSILSAKGEMRQIDESETEVEPSLSYTYHLSRLSSHFAGSPSINSFGFLFRTDFYQLGVRYTSEKQPNSLAIERIRNTYVVLAMQL